MKTWVSIFIFFFLISCSNHNSDLYEPQLFKKFKKLGSKSNLPDFSYAGYAYGEYDIPNAAMHQFNITDFGAIANDSLDDTTAINKTIEAAGKNKGGIVKFPPGLFKINSDTTKTNIVQINYSNVVLRGSGSGDQGTIIFSGSATNQLETDSPWLSPFVFHSGLNLHDTHSFFHVDSLPLTTQIIQDAYKGSTKLKVHSTENLSSGEYITIALQNTSIEGNLMNHLMAPLTFEPFQKSYTEAGKQKSKSFQWLVEIDTIINENTIALKQPLRRNLALKFRPTITKTPMLQNVGIEHFKFQSAWNGKYKHHGNREMDYGWGAINLHRVANGWVKDIHIDNYTQTTHLVNSKNVTIENILITGDSGHYSPKMYHSSDNLVQNIQVNSKMTHGPGLEGCSFGNVYKNITFKYPSTIDLHGIGDAGFCPPMYNLFENITNIEKIAGGGAPQNLPHAGEYNTFWNIEINGWKDGEFHEVFYSWIWRNPTQFKNQMHIDCHKQYLKSNLVGIKSKNPMKKLSVEHKFEDRSDEWIYVEAFNSSKKIIPLYSSQLALRLLK